MLDLIRPGSQQVMTVHCGALTTQLHFESISNLILILLISF